MLTQTLARPPVSIERRSADRSRVSTPAQLHLTSGIRVGALWDLSTGGARFEARDPPRVGVEALLKWQSHEVFCRVAWSADGMCGLAFHRPLSPTMFEDTLEEEERRTGPVAKVRNIPLGRKRSRLLFEDEG